LDVAHPPPPYLHFQTVSTGSTQALRRMVRYIQIQKVLIFWRQHTEGVISWRRFSYSKVS